MGGTARGVTLARLKADWMKRPGVKAAYDGMALEFEIASAIMRAQLASATGTKPKSTLAAK
jgi:hypothetical protein